jgi:hypothetical protein
LCQRLATNPNHRVEKALPESTVDEKIFPAKAQRKAFRNAAALCAFAPLREKSSREKIFFGQTIVLKIKILHYRLTADARALNCS